MVLHEQKPNAGGRTTADLLRQHTTQTFTAPLPPHTDLSISGTTVADRLLSAVEPMLICCSSHRPLDLRHCCCRSVVSVVGHRLILLLREPTDLSISGIAVADRLLSLDEWYV